MKNIVVLYHAECPDGFGGAWAAHKKFGSEADYIAVHHNHPAPDGLENKEIYLIDFTYPADVLKDLIAGNKRVTAIDHHASREEEIKQTQDYLYSNNHSGSVLAWTYFYPEEKVPRMLEYIEDRDLWRYKLENTDPVCTFIDTFDYDFIIWDKLVKDMEDESYFIESVEKGRIMFGHEQHLIRLLIEESARIVEFEGYKVYAVNAPHLFASHAGQILYKKKPPFAIIWSEDKERVNVSLRGDGSVNMNEIAQKFGGGGHRDASGFRVNSLNELPWKKSE